MKHIFSINSNAHAHAFTKNANIHKNPHKMYVCQPIVTTWTLVKYYNTYSLNKTT